MRFYNEGVPNEFVMNQLETVRSFFTDTQWDLIDSALSEYQDHDAEYLKEIFDDEDIVWSTQKRLNELF